MNTWFLVLTSVVLASAGQLFIKYGLNSSQTDNLPTLPFLAIVITKPYVIGGLVGYGFSLALWLLALRQAQLSLIYPAISLSYVLVAAGSILVLGETLVPGRIAGIAVIIIGVLLVARS